MAQQPLVGQGLLITEASRSYSRHTTLDWTPLDEWSARRRDLYLTKHNTHKRQTHPCQRQDSNPQSQEASGHRPIT